MRKSRPSKLKRLNEFRRSMPHVTASALSKVLHGISEQGMPSLTNRNDMREATSALMDEVTPHGPLLAPVELHKIDGTTETTLAVNPFAYLYHAYLDGGPFCTMLDSVLGTGAGSDDEPFRLVTYADEVVPGKELSHNNKRKHWAMYWSFGDFLPYFHLEETWIPLMVIRTCLVATIAGGCQPGDRSRCAALLWGTTERHLRWRACADRAGRAIASNLRTELDVLDGRWGSQIALALQRRCGNQMLHALSSNDCHGRHWRS